MLLVQASTRGRARIKATPEMNEIPIPQCYRRPFKQWLQGEYQHMINPYDDRVPTERQINKMMANLGLHITPVVAQTSIVFAVCTDEDQRMIRAVKIPREIGPADARFIMRVFAVAAGK